MFSERQWLGNLYMLDFTEEQGALLIDRIQIPRQLRVPYLGFFDSLAEALREMFRDVTYAFILAPLAISNHATIQKAFNAHRKKFPTRSVHLPSTHAKYFEGLQAHSSYHVLCQKEAG